MNRNKIIVLGTLPPPVGGVTIHVKRLLAQLQDEAVGYDFIDLRPKKKNEYIRLIVNFIRHKNKIAHYQLNNWKEGALISSISRLKKNKFIYTVHSFPIPLKNLSWSKRIPFLIIKRNTDLFVAPSNTIQKSLIEAGVKTDKIVILNTFLPPSVEERCSPVPEEILRFVNDKKLVMLANASQLYLNEKREDVYGLDLCIEACNKNSELACVFVCPVIRDQAYYEICRRTIQKYGIGNRFLFYQKNISLSSLFKVVDIFARPSASDSFGISVAEALISGVPAVASNVCERAEGTIVFEKGNLDDFLKKIDYAFNNQASEKLSVISYWEVLYKKLLIEK